MRGNTSKKGWILYLGLPVLVVALCAYLLTGGQSLLVMTVLAVLLHIDVCALLLVRCYYAGQTSTQPQGKGEALEAASQA